MGTATGSRNWIEHDPNFTNIRELSCFKQIVARRQ